MNDRALKVLVVDDDRVDYLATRRLLQQVSRTRYEVTWVSSSDAALPALLSGDFDVCLLDHRLDVLTGLDVLNRANEHGCVVPIIMLTGVGDEEIDMAAMAAGASDYLVKEKLDVQVLERTVRYAIGHKKSQIELKRYAEALEAQNRQLVAVHEELARKNAELLKLNEEKNRFVGMAAHDLRNPLGVILGYSDFMLMTHRRGQGSALKASEIEIVEKIKSSSKFMLSLINDLLDISMIEAGRLNLQLKSTDIAQLVASNVGLHTVLAGQKGITILLEEHDGDIPRADVDVHKVEQVLNNLISNAIHYSPQGTTIRVRVGGAAAEVTISVKDEGAGIAPEDIGNLFRPFGRAKTVSTGGERSTGLGLAIARRVVEGHGGRIWVESELGRGSTFFVAFPVAARAAAESASA